MKKYSVKKALSSFLMITTILVLFASCGKSTEIDRSKYGDITYQDILKNTEPAASTGSETATDKSSDPTFTRITVYDGTGSTSYSGETETTGRIADPTFTRITVSDGSGTTAYSENTTTTTDRIESATTAAESTATDASANVSFEKHPLFWKATKQGGGTVYLFGSIHVGRGGEQMIPDEVWDVFDKCEDLAVESDVLALESDLKLTIEYMKAMVYTDGTRLKDHVTAEQYEKITKLAEKYGLKQMMSVMEVYDCAFWFSYIEQAMMEKTNIDYENGVDRALLEKAKEVGKNIIELEDPIESTKKVMGPDSDAYYAMMLEAMYDQEYSVEDIEKEMGEMLDIWLRGDEAETREAVKEDYSDMTDEEKKIAEAFNEKMMTERNEAMIEKAKAMIDNGQTVLYVVGNAHIMGENGLVDSLRADGYTVERIMTELPD